MDPDLALWSTPTMTNMLLASLVDLGAIANWQWSGGKGGRPKPIKRPGVGPKVEQVEMDAFDTPADFDKWREDRLKQLARR